MAKVKICGLTRIEDIECVNEVLPDYVGFIFAPSRRQVSWEQALDLKNHLDRRILSVGVFVDEPVDTIVEILDMGIIDVIQLHGRETEAYIKTIRACTPQPIIKAVSVRTRSDLAVKTSADHLLFDHGSGGKGVAFDWSLLKGVSIPYFLAGGLSAENIDDALGRTTPFAVDVSSGVETNGLKDPDKVKELTRRVRRWT